MLSYFLLSLFVATASGQVASKAIIDFCTPSDPQSCGANGLCVQKRLGARCECPQGWMGRGCKRPCQDVYKSCKRWYEEKRCSWTKPISPFFADNCALSCGACKSNGQALDLALPPILDNIEWFVGRWESKTTASMRFPEPMSGPYTEVLDIQISEVPSFDRPPVNVTVTATTFDGTDTHREVGFLTSKPFNEDTGFVDLKKPEEGNDLVAIEMVTNTGLLLIEEGTVRGNQLRLETVYKKAMPGAHVGGYSKSKRLFTLRDSETLEERVVLIDENGASTKWLKRYRKTFDYLTNYISV